MKRILPLILLLVLTAVTSWAKLPVFDTRPAVPLATDTNLVLIYHPDRDNVEALKNLPPDVELYAHLGTTDWEPKWENVATDWNVNNDRNRWIYVAPNTYELRIGSIEEYFHPGPHTGVYGLAVIARTADGRTQTADNYVPLDFYPSDEKTGHMVHDAEKYVLTQPTTVNFKVMTRNPQRIKVYCNTEVVVDTTDTAEVEFALNFDKPGGYWCIAVSTREDGYPDLGGVSFGYPVPQQIDYPGGVPQMGRREQPDGSCIYCLAAPGKDNAFMMYQNEEGWETEGPLAEWGGWRLGKHSEMAYQDYKGVRYFWIQLPRTAAFYYYLIDGEYSVPDPYSRTLGEPWYDELTREMMTWDITEQTVDLSAEAIDLKGWQTPSNTDNMVVYEALLRDFYPGEDNMFASGAPLQRMIAMVEHLKYLGVTALELMPVMEFAGDNSWGYNTSHYLALEQSYGKPEDLVALVSFCHRAGISVILDIALNHADAHPWYQMYPKDQNPFFNATAPHAYSVLNDWRQEYPPVEAYWRDVLQYWMKEYGIDGYRFDLVKGLGDSDSYANGTEAYNQSRVDRMKRLHGYLKEVNPNAIHINEHFQGTGEENVLADDGQIGWHNLNQASRSWVSGQGANLTGFYAPKQGFRAGGMIDFAESHDEERVAYGNAPLQQRLDRSGALMTQMLMQPGPKMIWMWGELGYDTSINYGGDRTAPKTIDWDTWVRDPQRMALCNSVSRLCWLRRDNPELFSRDASITTSGLDQSSGVRWIMLTAGDKELVAVINPSTTATATATITGATKITKSNNTLVTASPDFDARLTSQVGRPGLTVASIPANGYAVFVNDATNGIDDLITDRPASDDLIDPSEPVEYYNLQGQRLLNPAPGQIVIRRQGSRTDKCRM